MLDGPLTVTFLQHENGMAVHNRQVLMNQGALGTHYYAAVT